MTIPAFVSLEALDDREGALLEAILNLQLGIRGASTVLPAPADIPQALDEFPLRVDGGIAPHRNNALLDHIAPDIEHEWRDIVSIYNQWVESWQFRETSSILQKMIGLPTHNQEESCQDGDKDRSNIVAFSLHEYQYQTLKSDQASDINECRFRRSP